MRSTATRSDTRDTAKALGELVAALQAGVCDEAAARRLYTLGPDAKKPSLLRAMNRRLYTLGPDAVALALLTAARRIAQQDAQLALLNARVQTSSGVSPNTPSGQRPLYTKPNAAAGRTARSRRRKRPGARQGHPGRRCPPPRIRRRRVIEWGLWLRPSWLTGQTRIEG